MTLRVPDPGRGRIGFTFEGRRIDAYEGESIGAALHAAGVHVLARSFKYHRPRGLYCVGGYCPSCAVRVDGLPGVPACVTAAREGQVVVREHAWPSADRDALATIGRLAALVPVGFQYRRFVRSPALFRRWERLLARLAGMAAPPEATVAAVAETRDVEVLVVGGGEAGVAAAVEAARADARVTLVEREAVVAGEAQGVEVLAEATAFGWYDEGCLGVAAPGRLLVLRPRALVLAVGSYDVGRPFPNGDLPGIFLAGGARRLLRRDRVLPGRRVVVLGDPELADELEANGAEVRLLPADVSALHAHGRTRVRALEYVDGGGSHRVSCDAVCIGGERRPALELFLQRTSYGSHLLESAPAARGTWVVRNVEEGRLAGRAAAAWIRD